MKKALLFLTSTIFLSMFFTLSPHSEAHAQGTYRCRSSATFTGRVSTATCTIDENNCDDGYKPDPNNPCRVGSCNNDSRSCVLNEPADSGNNSATNSGSSSDSYSNTLPGALKGGCTSGSELDTAIGCINIGNTKDLATFFFSWSIGFGGGIAFLMMVWGGYLVMISKGDPGKISGGKSIIESGLSGLLLLIFSTFFLELVGVDILGILPEG